MDRGPARAVVERPAGLPPTPWLTRLCVGVPYLVVAGVLTVTFVDYITGPIRITEHVRHVSAWLPYELLACVYASVLPLGMIVAGLVRAPVGRGGRAAGWGGSLLVLLPFLLLAWRITPAGMSFWGVAAFLALAFARWAPSRHGAGLIGDGLRGVAGGARGAVRVWSFFTASFVLSAFLILPLEPLLGLEMPSVDHGQVFLLLGGGVIYFLLNALFELGDVARRVGDRHQGMRRPRSAGAPASAAGVHQEAA